MTIERPAKPAMLANPIGRSTPEWWGKTNDTMPPARVVLRILARQGGLCALTGRQIRDGEPTTPDHIKELILGGENRESNIQIILRDGSAHGDKTNAAMKLKRKADKQKANGLMRPALKVKIKGKPFAPPAPKDRSPTPKSRVGDGSGRWMFGKFVPY